MRTLAILGGVLVLATACCARPCRTRCCPTACAPRTGTTTVLGSPSVAQASPRVVVQERKAEHRTVRIVEGQLVESADGTAPHWVVVRRLQPDHEFVIEVEEVEVTHAKPVVIPNGGAKSGLVVVEEGAIAPGKIRVLVVQTPMPAEVAAAVGARAPNGKIVSTHHKVTKDGERWEVDTRTGAFETTFLMDTLGRVLSVEAEVDPKSLPAAVVAAAEKAVAGAVTEAEEIRDGNGAVVAYVVEKQRGKGTVEIRLGPDGKVLEVDDEEDDDEDGPDDDED